MTNPHAGREAGSRPQILCAMRIPPNIDGVGGSQRAWRLLSALRAHGDVHFVLMYRDHDHDCMTTSLAPLEPLCSSVTRIEIAGWRGASRRKWGIVPGKVQDLVGMRSHEAPRFSARELRGIAQRLPIRQPDILFAGRLPTAVILQSLIDRGALASPLRIVDFDDVMSKARRSQLASAGDTVSGWRRALTLLDARIIENAERQIATTWNAVSVCTDEDAAALAEASPAAQFLKVPNVVDRPWLPPRVPDGTLRMLFVGNLSFHPNVDGLRAFVERAWPALTKVVPDASLTIVGINPSSSVVEIAQAHGFALHADVPSLQPYYEACDVVLAPILWGSGTRIKILEAMAYGRAVVSTPMGAEGMGLVNDQHVVIADDIEGFAPALIDLASHPERLHRLAEQARAFQQRHYTPPAVDAAVSELLERGRAAAARRGRPVASGATAPSARPQT